MKSFFPMLSRLLCRLVVAIYCLGGAPSSAQKPQASTESNDPFQNQAQEEVQLKEKVRCLNVLAAKVAHYEVKEATVSEALLKLWETVLGDKARGVLVSDELAEADKLPEACRITLRVDNTTVHEIIKLIRELSGFDVQIQSGGNLYFEKYRRVRCACGSEHSFADFLPFEKNAATALGLHAGMTSQEVIAVLKRFGLSFLNVMDVAIYCPPTERQVEGLIIDTRATDLLYVQSLVRLVNGGAKIELPKEGVSK